MNNDILNSKEGWVMPRTLAALIEEAHVQITMQEENISFIAQKNIQLAGEIQSTTENQKDSPEVRSAGLVGNLQDVVERLRKLNKRSSYECKELESALG